MQSWSLGFVSAFNAYQLKQSEDVSKGTNNAGLLAWLDNYCRANPLDTISRATDALVLELLKRSGAF
jgi:hypothetical protein